MEQVHCSRVEGKLDMICSIKLSATCAPPRFANASCEPGACPDAGLKTVDEYLDPVISEVYGTHTDSERPGAC